MPTQTLAPEILSAALHGLEVQRQRIDSQIADVRRMLRQQPASAATATAPETGAPASARPRRKMSAAARKRIAEAQRKRWAAFHGESEQLPGAAGRKSAQKSAKAEEALPRKRKMSAAGRKRIAEAARKRWAEFRKNSAKGKPVQSAKTAKKPRKKRTAKKAAPVRAAKVERGAEAEAAG